MAVAFDVADGNVSGSTTVTTSGVSPSGTNRLMLAVAVGEGDATDVKSGGSGGTSLTQVLADTTLFPFVIGNKGNVWSMVASPTGSTTGYATYSSGSSSALSTIYFTGVDQATPYTTPQTSNADGSSTPSLSMTGLSAGQPVAVALMVAHLPSALSGLTANGSTTVRRTDAGPLPGSEHQSMTLWLTGTADGSGNVTIGGTLVSSPDVPAWAMWGVGLNAASEAGTTGTITSTNGNDTSSSSGTTTVVGTLARTNGNDISASTGSTTIVGTLARTNTGDTMVASGSPGTAISGTIASTNNNDSCSAAGTTTLLGTIAVSNRADTSAITAFTTIIGTIGVTARNDTMSAFGFPGTQTITNIWRRLALSVRMSL